MGLKESYVEKKDVNVLPFIARFFLKTQSLGKSWDEKSKVCGVIIFKAQFQQEGQNSVFKFKTKLGEIFLI